MAGVQPASSSGEVSDFVQGSVVLGQLADALFERDVLGGDPLNGRLGPLLFPVAQLSHEDGDAGLLGLDLLVGALSAVSALRARSRHNASDQRTVTGLIERPTLTDRASLLVEWSKRHDVPRGRSQQAEPGSGSGDRWSASAG
jgi:hypothetical protein